MSPHLFVDISSHGFGHLGQVAPVLAALRQRLPNLHLTVRCGLAKRQLLTRIDEPFTHIRETSDTGFIQHDALHIDHQATREAYERAHTDWPDRLAQEAAFFRRLQPTLVLSDVAYLPLAGAALAGIPALAMSSLNWLDVARHYYGRDAWAQTLLTQMAEAYAAARGFIALTPHMSVPGDGMSLPVGPVARLATAEAGAAARQALDILPSQKAVLVAMGGFDLDLSVDHWPVREDLVYLLPEAWDCGLDNVRHYSAVDHEFTALLRGADAVLTKPGYGTFVEAACAGTPVLYLPREDWPEQPALIHWQETVGRCRAVSRDALASGDWVADLAALLTQPAKLPVSPTGIDEAVDLLLPYLG